MLAPYKGRIYHTWLSGHVHPARGVHQTPRRARRRYRRLRQESNYTTWRLAKMNLAIRGIDAKITHGDSFHNEQHPDLKADFVIANPPFNDSDWNGTCSRKTSGGATASRQVPCNTCSDAGSRRQ
jgi:type I restriction enzyme M protein